MPDHKNEIKNQEILIDGRTYRIQLSKRVESPPETPRLVIVAYQPNDIAKELVRTCIQSIQHFTKEDYELWVVDNNSPGSRGAWLLQEEGLNSVINVTEPVPPERRRFWWRVFSRQQDWGSYANAIGFEIASRLVDPRSQYLMTLHMDTVICRPGWLTYLHSKLDHRIRASGVHLQKTRIPQGVLHILGCLFDFQLFQKFNLDFLPQLPKLDVGDKITVGFRSKGYEVFACRDTFSDPRVINLISTDSPFRDLDVFRAIDDQNRVLFMHLGRGVRKTTGEHRRGVSPLKWLTFAQEYLLTNKCELH